MQHKTKIVFFGTPEFAVPTLKALIRASFCDVRLVITQPDKPIGRHHSKLIPSPVKKAAQEFGISVSKEIPPLASTLGRDDIVVGILVAYGKIIPKEIIDSFPLGILNIHPSLLQKYRGSSPIQKAILNQDKETGVTIIRLDHKMDHGPIVAQEKIEIPPPVPRSVAGGGLTTGELSDVLGQAGADLLIKILPDYIAGKIKLRPQDEAKSSYTKKLAKQDAKIDWSKSAQEIDAHIRAMNPWPGAWTMWKGKKLIIWKASKPHPTLSSKRRGMVLEEVQLEGKKKMPYSEFIKGHPNFNIN